MIDDLKKTAVANKKFGSESDTKENVLPAIDEPSHATPQEMSLGEKWYNRLVYQGLNYWVNLGISLVITDFFLHGAGKKFFTEGVAKSTSALTTIGMPRKGAHWLSEIALGTFSLNSGGNILLIPTKYLEDNKRAIVHWLNDKLGVDQTDASGHKMTPAEIYIEQEQDKQSWPRMIMRRLLGWSMTTTVGLVIDSALARKLDVPRRVPKQHIDPSIPVLETGELITHVPGQQVFTETALKGANYVLGNMVPGGKSVVNSPMAQRYMGYAALDWIYTIITSKVLHATNGAHKKTTPLPPEVPRASPIDITKPLFGKEEKHAPKPEEHKEEPKVELPEHKRASDIVSRKDKDESFAAAVRKSENNESLHLGA